MCMYYDENYYAKEDIETWIVVRRRKLGKRRRTVRHQQTFRLYSGKILESGITIDIKDNKILQGIFSYCSWCPSDDPVLEVWRCRIPKGTLVYSNAWEYATSKLEVLDVI